MSARRAVALNKKTGARGTIAAVPSAPKYTFTRNGSAASSEVFVNWGDMERRKCAPGSVTYQATAKATVDISRANERAFCSGHAWLEVTFCGYLQGKAGEWIALPTSKGFLLEGLRLEDLEPLAALLSALREQLVTDGLIDPVHEATA